LLHPKPDILNVLQIKRFLARVILLSHPYLFLNIDNFVTFKIFCFNNGLIIQVSKTNPTKNDKG